MVFIETSSFTRLVSDYLADDELAALQVHLVECPDAGDVIPGSRRHQKGSLGSKGQGKAWRGPHYLLLADSPRSYLLAYHLREE